MHFKTLATNESSFEAFIEFWSAQYDYPTEDYEKHIGVGELNTIDLNRLFAWKNGMTLSGKKQESFDNNILKHVDTINSLRSNGFDADLFTHYFSEISTIWKIFLMHIISPQEFPIFDQHVYRAYLFIISLPLLNLPANKEAKYAIYRRDYLPFYKEFQSRSEKFPFKKIDDALWALGKFLSVYPGILDQTADSRAGTSDVQCGEDAKGEVGKALFVMANEIYKQIAIINRLACMAK